MQLNYLLSFLKYFLNPRTRVEDGFSCHSVKQSICYVFSALKICQRCQILTSSSPFLIAQVKMHDKMGVQVIPLRLLTPYESKLFTLDLLRSMNPNDQQNKKNRGKLVVELTFDPFREENSASPLISDGEGNISLKRDVPDGGGVLLVTVENAEDVEGKRHTNPYAVVLFRGEKRETKVSLILLLA